MAGNEPLRGYRRREMVELHVGDQLVPSWTGSTQKLGTMGSSSMHADGMNP